MSVDMTTTPAADVMMAKFKDTDVRFADVYFIGTALLNCLGAMCTLGLSRPGHVLDYTQQTDDLATGLVRDFVALTSGRLHLAEGCDERLRTWVAESGWQRHQFAAMETTLRLGESA